MDRELSTPDWTELVSGSSLYWHQGHPLVNAEPNQPPVESVTTAWWFANVHVASVAGAARRIDAQS